MVRTMKKFGLLLACNVCGFISANAQRLAPKQKGIEIVASVPLIKGEKLLSKGNWGVGVSLTRNLKEGSYTFVRASYEEQALPYRSYPVPLRNALLQASYMRPFLSDRGKNILLYAGVSALGGYEEVNEGKPLQPDGARLLDRSRFVYGGAIHGSVECFLTDNLLLILRGEGRLLFGSDLHRFRPALSAGFRFTL